MRIFLLTALPLALTACGDGKRGGTAQLDSSGIATGRNSGTTIAATATDTPSSTGAPTEADVKAFVERKAKMLATGVGSSHSDVTVAFDLVQIADGRAVNQQDRIDGVRGDTAWPVRVRWTEHRKWGAGSTKDVTNYYSYDFYRDSFGGWDALGHGPVT